jgi:antitoxin (DNA-binding transcriptional repressor) of toxin-antitoxin stability system
MMTMKVVNINEVKAKLSEYLDAVARGETVVICNRNQPVAELKAIPAARAEPRQIGGENGIEILPSFYDPLPDDELDTFDDGPVFPETSKATRVAERGPRYRTRGETRRRR